MNINEIYLKIVALNKGKITVAIDGYIGSGKTFIANQIIKDHENEIVLIHGDDFLVSGAGRKTALEKYGPDLAMSVYGNRWQEIRRLVKAFKRGENEFKFKGFDHESGECNIEMSYNFTGKKILIAEGVFLIHPKTITDIWDYKIYVKGDIEKIDKRRIEREKARWGEKYFPETRPDSHMGMAVRAYKKFIEEYNPEHLADLVIDNSNKLCLRVINKLFENKSF
ncbi:MAG: hypothetical protein ABR875_01365 [Minisyncoccia bacterium]|jgi:uridine kinase